MRQPQKPRAAALTRRRRLEPPPEVPEASPRPGKKPDVPVDQAPPEPGSVEDKIRRMIEAAYT